MNVWIQCDMSHGGLSPHCEGMSAPALALTGTIGRLEVDHIRSSQDRLRSTLKPRQMPSWLKTPGSPKIHAAHRLTVFRNVSDRVSVGMRSALVLGMSAIANIGSALGYDAVEAMLASGRSLADCYAFAAISAEMSDVAEVEAPESARTVLAATVAPKKRAA